MRKLADESDGIHQQKRPALRQFHAPHNRVQCGKQHVLCQHVRAGKPVEQRRFSGIGIADQRDDRQFAFLSARALHRPLPRKLLHFRAQVVQTPANAPAADFQLRFARAARPDAAAQARQRHAFANQPRQLIAQLRHLHLQFSRTRLGALGENIQNQRGSVDDLDAAEILQIANLRAAEFVVHNHHVAAKALNVQRKVLRLPLPI